MPLTFGKRGSGSALFALGALSADPGSPCLTSVSHTSVHSWIFQDMLQPALTVVPGAEQRVLAPHRMVHARFDGHRADVNINFNAVIINEEECLVVRVVAVATSTRRPQLPVATAGDHRDVSPVLQVFVRRELVTILRNVAGFAALIADVVARTLPDGPALVLFLAVGVTAFKTAPRHLNHDRVDKTTKQIIGLCTYRL